MSEKTYSAEEVAKAVLKKCQDMVEANKIEKTKKEEVLVKAEEIDKCGDMDKPMGKSDKLKNFLDKKKKKKDLKKAGSLDALPGSVAQTGGPSIASQIGFGKKEVKKARIDEGKSDVSKQKLRQMRGIKDSPKDRIKGVHKPHFGAGLKTGTSEVGAHQGAAKLSPDSVTNLKEQHKKVSNEARKIKPNLPKSEDAQGTPAEKAIGLKPMAPAEAPKVPKVDGASKPPKAATTLKSFLAQKKK